MSTRSDREQRARDAVVRAAMRWVKRGSFMDDAALARAVRRVPVEERSRG